MQESRPVISNQGKRYQLPDYEALRSKPLEPEYFFTAEEFNQANEWDAQRITDALKKLRNSYDQYDPKKHMVPLPVAQMATYNYVTILNEQRRRSRIINGELNELTEFGLVRVLEFNHQKLLSLPGISALGDLTRLVSRQYRTVIEIRD